MYLRQPTIISYTRLDGDGESMRPPGSGPSRSAYNLEQTIGNRPQPLPQAIADIN